MEVKKEWLHIIEVQEKRARDVEQKNQYIYIQKLGGQDKYQIVHQSLGIMNTKQSIAVIVHILFIWEDQGKNKQG